MAHLTRFLPVRRRWWRRDCSIARSLSLVHQPFCSLTLLSTHFLSSFLTLTQVIIRNGTPLRFFEMPRRFCQAGPPEIESSSLVVGRIVHLRGSCPFLTNPPSFPRTPHYPRPPHIHDTIRNSTPLGSCLLGTDGLHSMRTCDHFTVPVGFSNSKSPNEIKVDLCKLKFIGGWGSRGWQKKTLPAGSNQLPG